MNAPALHLRVSHDEARQRELLDAAQDGYFENDPCSPYAPPASFEATCGCVAYRKGGWDDSGCKGDEAIADLREQEEMREEW